MLPLAKKRESSEGEIEQEHQLSNSEEVCLFTSIFLPDGCARTCYVSKFPYLKVFIQILKGMEKDLLNCEMTYLLAATD